MIALAVYIGESICEAAILETEYERVQKEMDVKLGKWEKMQGIN